MANFVSQIMPLTCVQLSPWAFFYNLKHNDNFYLQIKVFLATNCLFFSNAFNLSLKTLSHRNFYITEWVGTICQLYGILSENNMLEVVGLIFVKKV